MKWTKVVQDALEKKPSEKNKAVQDAKQEISLIMEKLTLLCRENLGSSLRRQKVETLVTIMVYLKDVTNTWRF